MTRYFDPVIQRFIKALCRILPDASTEDVYWSFLMLSGSIMLALSQTGRIDRLSEGKCNSRDLQAAFARLLPYSAGGYLAVCGKGRGSLDTKVQNSNFDANGSSGG